jgi:hypothetical protein
MKLTMVMMPQSANNLATSAAQEKAGAEQSEHAFFPQPLLLGDPIEERVPGARPSAITERQKSHPISVAQD